MELLRSNIVKSNEFELPGGKHSFAHSIASAALLKQCFIENVPNIIDSNVLIELLKNIFTTVIFDKNNYTLSLKDPCFTKKIFIKNNQLSNSRNIFCLLPALLNRSEEVIIEGMPTGCIIGKRPIDWYYEILEKFGVVCKKNKEFLVLSWKKKKNVKIKFEYPTMTGTVIALACSMLAPGKTILNNCSVEPSCDDQIMCMKKMKIKFIGNLPNIEIYPPNLIVDEINYTCTSDRVYAVTLLTAAILSQVKLKIFSKTKINIPQFVNFMKNIGLVVIDNDISIEVNWKKGQKFLSPCSINAGSEPKFSSDWVAFALLILSTKSKGESIITDDVFVNRFQFINCYDNKENFKNVVLIEKRYNGREITVAKIKGDGKLIIGGKTKKCPDIRGSAAIVLSALVSIKSINIFDQFQISRGYENFIETLINLNFIKEV